MVQAKQTTVNQSPQNEISRGTVPKPANEHGDKQVAIRFQESGAAPAQRNIEIFLEP